MKKTVSLLLLFLSFGAFAQTQQQIDNQYAFAKVYGYLKYFYPGDDATKIDWDKFAIYGAQKVETCKNSSELKNTLNELVGSIMPGVKVIGKAESYKFDADLLTPKDLKGYDVVSWQHLGLGSVKEIESIYRSARTNRPQVYESTFEGFGNVSSSLKATPYLGKSIELTGKVKMISGAGDGHLWMRMDDAAGKFTFFDNMDDRPIKDKEWATFKIATNIDKKTQNIYFGTFLGGLGSLLVDDLSLKIDGKEVYSANFESEVIGTAPKSINAASPRSNNEKTDYKFLIAEKNGNKHLAITSPLSIDIVDSASKRPFEEHAKFGEYIEKSIGNGLKVIVPIALYGTKNYTFPKTDSLKTDFVLSEINNSVYVLNASNINLRLGNIINIWNVLQHFYPYFDVAKTNWDDDLKLAIKENYSIKDANSYADLLKRLTAKVKDGHINIWDKGNNVQYFPPIAWKWAGKDLVITSIMDSTLKMKKGDIVKRINGEEPSKYFDKININISAGTNGYLNHRAQTESLIGLKGKPLDLTMENGEKHKLSRNINSSVYYPLLSKRDTIKSLGNEITYINIGNAKMKIINEALPLLQKSKAIICDLRGYPTDNVELIQYLMTKNDTSSKWMQVPKIIYPDQEKVVGFENHNWGLTPKSPHLKAKIFFLIDGQAISYAESYMSFIEHYKLATIIGQPTAGTNGNVNTIKLPGGYSFWFTGMKVSKHDGSQHHGIGIIPNIYVEQTAKGIKEGKDEILERAIAEANK